MSKATFDPRKFNKSSNAPFSEVMEANFNRRAVLKGGVGGMAALGMLSTFGLSACSSSDSPSVGADQSSVSLGFESIPGSLTDAVTVAAGYTASVLAPWGTPLNNTANAWRDDGTNTAEDQANSVGMHHDGMHFFPLNDEETDGLLCINHEYIDQNALHPAGATRDAITGMRTDVEEVRKEINAHGVSVIRIRLTGDTWSVVDNDSYNRRFTGATEMRISGPVTQDPSVLVTPYSQAGDRVRGTLNNCGNGYTPWGTYLTCEENWPGYFVNTGTRSTADERLGVDDDDTRYGWDDVKGDDSEVADEFTRFDATPSGSGPTTDYRNEPNGHGYIVEIDPYDNTSMAVKRTALGRIRHEGCVFGKLTVGQPVVFYTGHDGRFEYMYKFVSTALWDAADASPSDRLATGAKYMDEGTLYVMRFNDDNTGEWIPLVLSTALSDNYIADNSLTAGSTLGDMFSSLGELILNTPGAADAVGATPMDRPEWCAVDPITGSVYLTLTNNTRRDATTGTNPANPRLDNKYGHILRWDESAEPTAFEWDIFVFGAPSSGVDAASYNNSGLTEMNQFASPDGLLFDNRGIMWIQTDNGADEVENYTNDQMLAVIPSKLRVDGEQQVISAENQDALRRFFVGPNGCEVTGLAIASDNSSFFANIQHPDNWPYAVDATTETPSGTSIRPRAATVVFRKTDGGAIGV
ncbi:MAG: PhoX family phosphatase [Oleiphilaceae bacterium]|nr:PhoX family phosphatase [Oleiphilaceae bacterium]